MVLDVLEDLLQVFHPDCSLGPANDSCRSAAVRSAVNVAIALFESPELDLTAAQKTMTDDGYLHFAFGAPYDRFDATLQALKESGVEMDGEPRDWGEGVSIYFPDPDGHQIEIHFDK